MDAFSRDILKRHEGLRLTVYLDSVGKRTIGYGRNLDGVDLSASEKDFFTRADLVKGGPVRDFDGTFSITTQEAELLFNNDVLRTETLCEQNISFFSTLPEVKKGILINMAFNMGINRLLKFKKTLLALELKDYSLAATEMLKSKWAKQVGDRAIELSNILRLG